MRNKNSHWDLQVNFKRDEEGEKERLEYKSPVKMTMLNNTGQKALKLVQDHRTLVCHIR